jgi:hypothetical protein
MRSGGLGNFTVRYEVNRTRRWAVLGLSALLAFTFPACKDGLGVDDSETQMWRFSALDDNGNEVTAATAECLPGGACSASSWTLLQTATFGCTHKVDFAVQFSGDQVRLMTFAKTFDSDCSNTSTVGNGTGVADAAYPNATEATGTVTLNTTSPIGPGGGTGNWSARLIQ